MEHCDFVHITGVQWFVVEMYSGGLWLVISVLQSSVDMYSSGRREIMAVTPEPRKDAVGGCRKEIVKIIHTANVQR